MIFSLDDHGKLDAQKAMEDAVRADCANFPETQNVAVQELKSKTGHGAYAVFTSEGGPMVAMHPIPLQMMFCRFASGGFVISVCGKTTNEMRDPFDAALKFISEGIVQE
ncbi:MAG TPA: hypothetical protein VG733_03555 [Chthoniobacteraceae bacterium]|nr:hypothetical protein [Chthoniobacteraceae bacterium]